MMPAIRIRLCLCYQYKTKDMRKECGVKKNWCLSSEAIPQEVFCANNTTRDSVVLWSYSSVLHQVCANLENIFKIRWD